MAVTLDFPYTTRAAVQDEIQNHDEAINDLLDNSINLASRAVDDYCRRDFKKHDHSSAALTVKSKWVCGDMLYLPWKLVSFAGLTIGTTDEAAASYLVEESDSQISFTVALDRQFPYVGPGSARISVKGVFGWNWTSTTTPAADLPAAVVRATTQIAAAWSGHNMKDQIAVDGSKTEVIDNQIPREAKMILAKYRWMFL